MPSPVAILFAANDSVYNTLPDCDVYDVDRDARTYRGPWPVVAHPPCRGWCRLRALSHATARENALAIWTVACVRVFGGVLEHPMGSALWPYLALPRPGAAADSFGGFTLQVDQHDWGHLARKRTWLYISSGMGRAAHTVAPMSSNVDLADVPVGNPIDRVGTRLEEVGSTTDRLAHPAAQWLPALPQRATDEPPCTMGSAVSDRPRVPRRLRDATPIAFAKWLCQVARSTM